MKHILLLVMISQLLFIHCDNREEVRKSKNDSSNEALEIESMKNIYETSIDSLKNEIGDITSAKKNIMESRDYLQSQVYKILNNAFFDHFIIGTNNLSESKNLFEQKLGFKIKNGKQHKNGISNFFVEFEDSSEIEIMSLKNPSDALTRKYSNLLENNSFGFQFALRTNNLELLSKYFEKLNSEYDQLDDIEYYSTLSNRALNTQLPLFFIKYKKNVFNDFTSHNNGAEGIGAIWYSTKKLKPTILQFANLGFKLIDKIELERISNRTVIMANKNIRLFLIEDLNIGLTGITIKVGNLAKISEIVKNNLNIKLEQFISKRGKSIYLNPKITGSVWLEFLE